MQKAALVLALLLLPALASAAGFAKQSLFLSRPSVTEGETVIIHAVVSNEAAAKFAGSLVFTDAGANIGSVPVALAAGESSVVSVSWKPAAGTRTVSAALKDSTGTQVEEEKGTFNIAAKPVPVSDAAQSAAAVESSAKIQQGIAGFSPAAASASAPLFTAVDSGRAALSDAIDGQIAATKKSLGTSVSTPGDVLGAEAVKNAGSNPMATVWFILQTLYLYILTILNFIIGSAGVFYPVAALLVLYILWKLFSRFRRPAY